MNIARLAVVLMLGATFAGAAAPESKPMDALAARYGVPTTEIEKLRASGLGWGEISHALAISKKAGVPLDQVLALRQSGMGWGEIAKKYGFKLGDVARQSKRIEIEGERAEKSRHADADEREARHSGEHGDRLSGDHGAADRHEDRMDRGRR